MEVYKPLERPRDGLIIHGLFIDAGRWEMTLMKLVDAKPGKNSQVKIVLYNINIKHNLERIF